MEEFENAYLLYPNDWRLYIPEKKRCFNWFICCSRYLDTGTDLYVAEISTTVRFYDKNTGVTSTANGLSERGEAVAKERTVRPRLLITSDPYNSSRLSQLSNKELVKLVNSLGYDGYVHCGVCTASIRSDNCIVCNQVVFTFRKGILQPIRKIERCPIIIFATTNNSNIREIVPDFPSVEEIEEEVKSFSDDHSKECEYSKRLFEGIEIYLSSKRE